ncbi:unnamed protein product [Orchesella dallaii]|uniref:Gustatory receptor n=1 Tax=Orchesella dallaii TaxID=48710 RepID=A0ABP1R551_9HEXA
MDTKISKLLRPLLRLGQILGFPIPETNGKNAKYSRRLVIFYSLFLTVVSLLKLLVALRNVATATEEVTLIGSGIRVTYHFAELALYTYLLLSHKSFETLLQTWSCTNWYIKNERGKFSSIYLSIMTLFGSAILETTLYDYSVYTKRGAGDYANATLFEKYVDVTLFEVNSIQSIKNCYWNPLLLGIYYVLTKFLTFATDYSDALCITLAFGLSARLKTMNDYLKSALGIHSKENIVSSFKKFASKTEQHSADEKSKGKIYWQHIYRDFVNLRKLSDLVSTFISPLICVSLLINVFAVVSYLHHGITISTRSQRNPFSHTSVYISLWHYMLRTVLVIYFASGVHKNSNDTLTIIENAPEASHTWTLDYGINASSKPRRTPLSHTSVYISLWHYLIRLVFVIYFASGVYMDSDETLSAIEDAPDSIQARGDTQPILEMLKRKPIGIIFFDSFYVTKCCFISILNFVFTIEIMILQASSTAIGKVN